MGGSGARLYDDPDLKLFILVGWDWSSFVQWCCLTVLGSSNVTQHVTYNVESSSLLLHDVKPVFICLPLWFIDDFDGNDAIDG